ncbi:MAG: Gfo/Idh/MocA family protein [Mycetocola sp.]
MTTPLGIAVIGAGMAGRAHAAAYRVAPTLYSPTLPPVRLVSPAHTNAEFGALAAQRFGYERHDTSWQAIAEADDIQVVSVVIANSLHREAVEGLLAAGKHVLCEKPLSDTLADARAMVTAANNASGIARVGFTYLRTPGIALLRQLITDGTLGALRHISGRYWTDYAVSADAPISWRYQGPLGSGALADVGSHLAYVAEFLAGPTVAVSGGRFTTAVTERPVPLGAVFGHDHAAVSDELSPVTNDDYAAYSAEFAGGASGGFEVSRIAPGHANSLIIEIFCERGSAIYDQRRPAEIQLCLTGDDHLTAGYRRVTLGPQHPYIAGGLAMDAPSVGFGQNDAFAYQARAFLDEVAGVPADQALPPCARMEDGLHNMSILAAVTESAASDGRSVTLTTSPTA